VDDYETHLNFRNGLFQFTPHIYTVQVRVLRSGIVVTSWCLANGRIVEAFQLGQYKALSHVEKYYLAEDDVLNISKRHSRNV
jgi:hypothetical protein